MWGLPLAVHTARRRVHGRQRLPLLLPASPSTLLCALTLARLTHPHFPSPQTTPHPNHPAVNQPEWCLVDAACHAYSMVSVPLYDTLGPDTGALAVCIGLPAGTWQLKIAV